MLNHTFFTSCVCITAHHHTNIEFSIWHNSINFSEQSHSQQTKTLPNLFIFFMIFFLLISLNPLLNKSVFKESNVHLSSAYQKQLIAIRTKTLHSVKHKNMNTKDRIKETDRRKKIDNICFCQYGLRESASAESLREPSGKEREPRLYTYDRGRQLV